MKFRTDFVTNSSDSSYLTFNIKNKVFYDYLSNLGMRFENTKPGEFSDRMRVVLPSGASARFGDPDNWNIPFLKDCPSISAWIVALLVWESGMWEDEYSDFSKELIVLLDEAGIHFDEEMKDLSAKVDRFDENIEEAVVEHIQGSEGLAHAIVHASYTEVHDGKRMGVQYNNEFDVRTEACKGLEFVVTGELKFFENREQLAETIKKMRGKVSDRVSENTAYLICSDIHSDSSEMEKAKELGISVLPELAFIRRFCNEDEFDGIKEEGEVDMDAGILTLVGGVFDYVVENGMAPIVMEVWKDGKWQKEGKYKRGGGR